MLGWFDFDFLILIEDVPASCRIYLILFFAMKTSLHDLILFFCNGDFIARPDSFFVMVLPFRSHCKKNQALSHLEKRKIPFPP